MMSFLILIFIAVLINISFIFGNIRRLNRINWDTYKRIANSGDECLTTLEEYKLNCPIEPFLKGINQESLPNTIDNSYSCNKHNSESSTNQTSSSIIDENGIKPTSSDDKSDIKCDEGYSLHSLHLSVNKNNSDEVGYSYTCIQSHYHGCNEINIEKLLTTETNPFLLFPINSLSSYTADNKIINRIKLNMEYGLPNKFSYLINACKKGKRIECGPNNSSYVMPALLGGKDRLCSGCSNIKNVLKRGEIMWSEVPNFYLMMQEDNNLVLYRKYQRDGEDYFYAVWSTDTQRFNGEYHLFVETDGLLKLANPNDKSDVIWTGRKKAKIHTDHQPAYMVLGNSGVMAAFQCGKPYWSSFTWSKEIELPD